MDAITALAQHPLCAFGTEKVMTAAEAKEINTFIAGAKATLTTIEDALILREEREAGVGMFSED
jgi:hypothetical protein